MEFEVPVEWGMDMESEHERFLAEKVFEGPLICTNYPKGIKAFYMKLDEDGRTVQVRMKPTHSSPEHTHLTVPVRAPPVV